MRPGDLIIQDLSKAFGALQVLRGVSLTCEAGAIHGLVGRNGSGKSTLLNCLSGRVAKDSGIVRLSGVNLPDEAAWKRARRGFGWTFQDVAMPLTLSPTELVKAAVARSARGPRPIFLDLQAATRPFMETPWNRLSFGQRKLAALLVAVSRNPAVLLLDEPVAGLSPAMVEIARNTLQMVAGQGAVVLVVEHNKDFLMQVTRSVSVISGGSILLSGTAKAVFADSRTMEALI
ncbi:MAG: ATP-binding cassette domain-containing protein [Caulobacter sp.]|nr:ATP-binding cassette domain-containing protein [Caulobacter sp.]